MSRVFIFSFFSCMVITAFASVPPDCYELIWSDEFEGTQLALDRWSYQIGAWNGSNVQNCYRQENVSVANGNLTITARHEFATCNGLEKNFTSGFVQTKNVISWKYGYFEARVKLPASNSTWPAFWMSPIDQVYGAWPRSGEIDIFEGKGHDMKKVYANAIWGNSSTDKRQQKGPFTIGDASQWHIYGVEWNEGELRYYIDGIHYHTISDFKEPNAGIHPQPFDQDFYLRLNLAVGGDYLDEPWNDANNGIDQLPATMEVDWVRVYQVDDNCAPVDACQRITDGDFQSLDNDWQLVTFNDADGSVSVDNSGYARIDVAAPGTSDWHLALRQSGVTLTHGSVYEVSFVSYADAPRSANVIMTALDGSQYHYQALDLTECPTPFHYQFKMSGSTDPDARFNFGVGSSVIDAYIENVSVRELGCVNCPEILSLEDLVIPPGNYQAHQLIRSNGSINNPGHVIFKAMEILLEPDFNLESGAEFEIINTPCDP